MTNIFEVEFEKEVLGFLPDAAGFVWTAGAGSLSSVTVFDAFGEMSVFSGADLALNPFTAEDDRFIGFRNPAGISRIMVQRTVLSNSADQLPPFVDHLQYGLLVPEPPAVAILMIAIPFMLTRRKLVCIETHTTKGVTNYETVTKREQVCNSPRRAAF